MGSGSPRRETPLPDHTAGGIRLALELFFLNFQKRHRKAPAHTFWRRPPSSFTHLLSKLGTVPRAPNPVWETSPPKMRARARARTRTTCAMAIKGGCSPTIRLSDLPWLGLNRRKEAQVEMRGSRGAAGPSTRCISEIRADLLRKAGGVYQPLLPPGAQIPTFS